jgi:hypothetical protein
MQASAYVILLDIAAYRDQRSYHAAAAVPVHHGRSFQSVATDKYGFAAVDLVSNYSSHQGDQF